MSDTTTTACFCPSGRRVLVGALLWYAFTEPELLEIGPLLTPPDVAAWLTASPQAGHRLLPGHWRIVQEYCGVVVDVPEVQESPPAAGDEFLVMHPSCQVPLDDAGQATVYEFRIYRLWRMRRQSC